MITNFDDFCLWVYSTVEETFRQIEPLYYPYLLLQAWASPSVQ